MGRTNSTTHPRAGKQLNHEERIQLEVLLKQHLRPSEIAPLVGRSVRTLQREILRGAVAHLNSDLTTVTVYSADRGQDVHDLNATAKGPQLKLGTQYAVAVFIHDQIVVQQCSPAVVAHRLKTAALGCTLCPKTLYTYVEQGWIPGVTNESLWEKRKRHKKGYKTLHRKAKKAAPPGHSINDRPPQVADREEFGHWEIDLIVSGKGAGTAVLLTLVERKTRKLIIRKLADKTQAAVLKALAAIERAMGAETFRVIFKSITVDNGSEFLDVLNLEGSCLSAQNRTRWYYAHPFSAWERGSNENANRMIRRFIAKGANIAKFSLEKIQWIEDWLNRYPRKSLAFQTAAEKYTEALAA